MTADVRPSLRVGNGYVSARGSTEGDMFKLSVTPSSAADGTEVSGGVDFLIMDEPA